MKALAPGVNQRLGVMEYFANCINDYDMKEASADGKLTKDEIGTLGDLLLEMTLEKISSASIGVLRAANVDINAIITGAGEAMIARMKRAA